MENITADYNQSDRTRQSQENLWTKIESDAGAYGVYTVVENKFIKFDEDNAGDEEADAEAGDSKDLLKVTVQIDFGKFRYPATG